VLKNNTDRAIKHSAPAQVFYTFLFLRLHCVIPGGTRSNDSSDLAQDLQSGVSEAASTFDEEKLNDMSTDTTESLRIFLSQQLKDVERDIETISDYISYNPPETSGELLKMRELQRKYREIATSIKNEIAKLERAK
jgi:hypothetical protein